MIHSQTELWFDFFRHGQSTAQLNDDLIGGRTPEAGLTPLGFRQSDALAKRLAQEGISYDKVYHSPLIRAEQTSRPTLLALAIGIQKVVVVPALTELDQGEWQGRLRSKIMTPRSKNYIDSQSPWFCPPGGESQKMAQRRMGEWLECEVLRKESYRKAGRKLHFAVFGHGTSFKCLFHDILEFRSSLIRQGMYIKNCSLTRLCFSQDGWAVDCLNDTGHLVGLPKSIS